MPGYKREILEKEKDFKERLLCCVCQLLLKLAVQTTCGHRCCKACVEEKFASIEAGGEVRCPVCPADAEDGVWNKEQIYPDFNARKELKHLKVKCHNDGCPWRGIFQQYIEHELLCALEPMKCAKPGCGKVLRRGDLQYHLENDCLMRIVRCRNCGEEQQYKQLKTHSNVCPKASKTCGDCKKKMTRESLSRHQDFEAGDCPNRKQKCPYSVYGCDEQILSEGMYQHLQTQAVYHVELQNIKFEHLVEKIQGFLKHGHGNPPGQVSSSSPPKIGRLTVDGEGEYTSLSNGSEGAAGGAPSEASYMQMSSTPYSTFSDDEINRLRIIFQKIFITRSESTIENKSKKSNNSPTTGRSLYQTLEKKLKDTEIMVNQKLQELEQMKTLYAVLDKRNETFQEVVAVLNNQLEAVGEKVSALERQNRHLQDTVEQQERQLHAHDQMLTVKNVALAEQDLRIQSLEASSFNGILVWKITEYARRRREAVSGKTTSFYSSPFYTSYHGYKMCARIYLNGDGMGKGTHLSLFFVVMKGQYDNILRWPFRQKVTFMMVDQGNREHVVDAFRPDPTSSSFKKPVHEMNIASGCPLFVALNLLENGNFAYVKDDCLFVKVIVDVSDLERI
ncbi:TNF receptor-associated factor 2-like [Amphiura filiformis]|uniref:TNF receptor-associated factor 2-like n=1 Tax=Amphiura filiformis TaxID=82378 RepID=UPI003B223892